MPGVRRLLLRGPRVIPMSEQLFLGIAIGMVLMQVLENVAYPRIAHLMSVRRRRSGGR